MRFNQVSILGTAIVQPPVAVTTEWIEDRLSGLYERLKLPKGRLEMMTGIECRHFWKGDYLPSQASADAGKKVLETVAISRDEIGFIAHCGVCRDRLEPATAAYVHGLLELSPKSLIFDISNACLGFLNAMSLAAGLIESGQIKYALLVSGENGKPLLEKTIKTLNNGHLNRKQIKPYFANLTIGAGAVAMILGHRSLANESSLHLSGGFGMTDSKSNQLCQGDSSVGNELDMQTDAELLLEAGIVLAKQTWDGFLQEMNWERDMIDHVICHQVGKTHQRKLLESLEISSEKDYVTYPYMGNVGSVSLPFTLHQAVESGKIQRGQKTALLGIGSGLSSLMMGVES